MSALWSGSPYPALILATRDDLVRARWEDGSEQWIDAGDVQSVEGSTPTGVVRGCPHRPVLVDEGVRTRVGRLLACDAGSASVLAADGTVRTIALSSLARAPIRLGDAIEARWSGTPYEAVVTALGDRLHVRWYDGSENDVDPADVITVRIGEARPSEPPSCPAP